MEVFGYILLALIMIFLKPMLKILFSTTKKEGEIYYPNGKVKGRAELNGQNQLNGIEERFYESGKIKAKLHWHNNVLEGVSEFYYENGNLKSRVILINGKVNGIMENYYENGKLESRIPFENDEPLGIAEDYYENGNLESKYYIDGLHREHICCWCEDGKENEVVNTYNKIMREVRRK